MNEQMNYMQLKEEVNVVKLLDKAEWQQKEFCIDMTDGWSQWFKRYIFQCYDHTDKSIKSLSVGIQLFNAIDGCVKYGDQRLYKRSTEYCFSIAKRGFGMHTHYEVKPLTKWQYKLLTCPIAQLVKQKQSEMLQVPQKWWKRLLVWLIKKTKSEQPINHKSNGGQ